MRAEVRTSMKQTALSVALSLLAGAACAGPLGWLWAPDPRAVFESRHDVRTFSDLARWPAAAGRFENDGFVPCTSGAWAESGWCLPPGRSGTIRYVLPETALGRAALARLFFFTRDPAATQRLRVFRAHEAAPRLTVDGRYFADARLDLSAALAGEGGPLVLSFEGANPTDHPDVMLQHLEMRVFAEALPPLPSTWPVVLALAILMACWLPVVSWRRLVPLAAVLLVGAALRYQALQRVVFLPLDWDAVGYLQYARQMTLAGAAGFYSAAFGNREPFFIAVVKAFLSLFGDGETRVRLASLTASLLVITLVHRVAGKLFGRALAVIGALLVAVSLPMVRESVRGLRLETELSLLLLFVDAGFLSAWSTVYRRALLVGVIGGALVLTRTTYLVTAAPLAAWAMIRAARPIQWGAAGLALAVMLVLQVPHRWSMWQRHGNAFWDTSVYGQWNANLEFAGQPGFLSKEETWQDAGRGRPMSYGQYLFGLHSVREVAVGTLRGLWKAIRHMDLVAFHRGVARAIGVNLAFADWLFQALGLLGLLLLLVNASLRWVPLTFLALLLPITFLYDRGLIEPWRHTYQAFPWMVLGALSVMAMGRRAWSRR